MHPTICLPMMPDTRFDETFSADADVVRSVLAGIRHGFLAQSPPDLADRAELLLAEALNNIVEHAYAGQSGALRLVLLRRAGGLVIRLLDHGAPMPGLALPRGDLPDMHGDSLPEGGFGWFLIRSLSHRLGYRRLRAGNLLVLVLSGDNP